LSQVHRRHHNKIMFRKIITYFLILAVVLPIFASVFPFGAGVKRAEAANPTTQLTSSDGKVYDPCGKTVGVWEGRVGECLSYQIVSILYDWVLQGTIWVAGLAGSLFNASIQFSLTGDIFDADKNIMIKDGWTMVRDLLNLIFIFILLYAAISTILQYGNMDIKKILPSLIIAALLINFSMLITKMVIDASHIFAWEFYNQIDVKNEEKLGDGELFANMKNDIEVYGEFEKKNLANVFMAGFNPQELLTGKEKKKGEDDKDANKSQWKQVLQDKIDKGESISDAWWQMGLILILESVLAIFAGFILLAGAIMFVVRVVVLWLVMIFSPLAFLGMILPSMQKYSKMWLDYLIGQSFFAPAFLFMFMLVTKFINSDFIDSIFRVSETSDSFIVLGVNGGAIALTFFHFAVVAGLMMACLIVARQLGGKTAEFGIGGAHRVKGWALGAPGKALKYGQYGVNNRLGRWLGGWGGDKILESEGKFSKTLKAIPGVEIGLRKLGAVKKADEDKARKAAEKYAGTLSKAGVASLKRDIEETKGVGGFVKRFAYTGPEGAFKPGKEGYEKIIAKKDEEKKEKELYHESWAYLLGDLKHGEDYSSEEGKKNKEKKIKDIEGRIRRGELGLMEEEVEKLQKARTLANEKAKEENNLETKKNEREIRVLEAQQAELYKEGKHSAMKEARIDELDKAIAKINKTNAEMTVTEKAFERHEKRTESYRSRQELKGKPSEEKKPEKKKD